MIDAFLFIWAFLGAAFFFFVFINLEYDTVASIVEKT